MTSMRTRRPQSSRRPSASVGKPRGVLFLSETLLQLFRDQAGDPEMTLNWFDAAVLTQKRRGEKGRKSI